jgi:hypothetical protein
MPNPKRAADLPLNSDTIELLVGVSTATVATLLYN